MRDHEGSYDYGAFGGPRTSPEVPKAPSGDILSILADVHARLSKVEADNAAMREEIETAKKDGALDLDTAHIVHVLNKHFYHDRPETEKAPTLVPKFDPFTGQALQ